MALSYEYSIGSVRAKEKSLFSSVDFEHMLGCKNEIELIRYLNDKGYGSGNNIDDIISEHTAEMWKYLRSVAPDFDIFNPFFYQNDIHNLKVVLKGIMSGRDFKSLLLNPCTISADDLKTAVENRRFSILPDWLSGAADRAYEIIAHTGDARLCDAVIDRAVMKKLLECGEKSGSDFLKKYFRTTVFYSNVKIAIRSARTGTNMDYLIQALCDVPEFRMSDVTKSALKGTEALIDTLSRFSEYDCNKAMEEYKKSPSAFEKFVDNRLVSMTKTSCKRTSSGAEPLMGYYLGCEAEKKAIHIIASGLRTKSDTETIRERLREVYG
ncbi:MAG: V-type ATPase subunit [Ruminococcus sp.]|nr:V-type ATPase subunit [Ruminococcus sp.]